MSRSGLDTISADRLMAKQIRSIDFVVPEILPVGLTLLAGRPKLGKSWLALNMAIGVALGTSVLDHRPSAADVLFLSLEDGELRFRDRLRRLIGDTPPPRRLHLATHCDPLDAGGEAALRAWLGAHPDTRLVVIDIFQRIRPKAKAGASIYGDDYAAILPLKDIAAELNVALIAVVHARKGDADTDPLDSVSATTGLAGAADHVLVLSRDQIGTVLYGRGRDTPEFQFAVRLDENGWWRLIGDRDEVNRSASRNAILRALAGAPEGAGPAQIAAASGLTENVVKQRLRGMVEAGEVIKELRGRYCLPHSPIVTSVTSVSTAKVTKVAEVTGERVRRKAS